MGQQQILLIVLGVIIVGIAVVVGINMFTATAAQANMDTVINDLLVLGARAQQYYEKPTSLGGGGRTFQNMTIEHLTPKPINENGTYAVRWGNKRKCVLRGIGKFSGDSGEGKNGKIRVFLHVYTDSSWVIIRQR
jgi:hypothetical protein